MADDELTFRVATLAAPEAVELIVGQGFFSPYTVEDLFRAVAVSAPACRFGIGMVEGSSGIVRRAGNDAELVTFAAGAALEIGAGHCFVVALRDAFPIQVLGQMKTSPAVATIFCATGNALSIVVADRSDGSAVVGAIDGQRGSRIESEGEVAARRALMRQIGYLEQGPGEA